jgi:hypothetical protein
LGSDKKIAVVGSMAIDDQATKFLFEQMEIFIQVDQKSLVFNYRDQKSGTKFFGHLVK